VGAAARGVNRSKIEIGKLYGTTEVLRRTANDPRGNAVYLCKCACGNIRHVLGTRLLSGTAQYCRKCGYTEHLAKLHQAHTKPIGEASAYAAFVITKRQCADQRNLVWEIPFDWWRQATQQPCHYCNSPPSNFFRARGRNGDFSYNGLDRVDNNVGYTIENVVPCCKRCNQAKSDQSVVDFLAWIRRVYEHTTGKSVQL